MSPRPKTELNHRGLHLDIQTDSKETSVRSDVWTTCTDQPADGEAKPAPQAFNGTVSLTKKNKVSNEKREKEKKPCQTPPVVEPALSFRERYLSWRYAMVLLLHSSFAMGMFLRSNMPIALVCMSQQPTSAPSTLSRPSLPSSMSTSSPLVSPNLTERLAEVAHTSIDEPVDIVFTTIEPPASQEFSWDSQTQGLILTSSMLLSFAGPLLSTSLQACVSSKSVLSGASLLSAVLTLLSPLAARLSPYCLVAVRVLLGLVLGANIPVVGDSLAWWAPLGEKLTMVSFTFMGINVAGIIAPVISGFMCTIPVDNGWPFIFYVFGGLALVWCVAWHFLGSQKPDNHPFITAEEKEYIVEHRKGMEGAGQAKREKRPYFKMLTSLPVLAFFVTGCCHRWSVTLMFIYVPAFFTDVLEFSVQEIGVLMSVLGVVRMLGALIWTGIGNLLAARFSTRVSRKVCLVSGFTIAGCSLLGMSFFGRAERWLSFSLLLVCMMAQSCGVSALTTLPLDMAPRYAGRMTGIFSSVSGLVAISGPVIVSLITTTGSQAEWQVVWCIMGAVFLLAGLVFGALGSATLQPWAAVNRPPVQDIALPSLTPQQQGSPLGRPNDDAGFKENGSGSPGQFDFSIDVPPVTLPPVTNYCDMIIELPTDPGVEDAGGNSRLTTALVSGADKTGRCLEENEEAEDVSKKNKRRAGGLENEAYENDVEDTYCRRERSAEKGQPSRKDEVRRDINEGTVGITQRKRFGEEEHDDIDKGTVNMSQREKDNSISIRL